MHLRVASLNANKGTYSARIDALLAWVDRVSPSILLLQEPWHAGWEPLPALGPLRLIQGNSNVAAYALEPGELALARFEDRWLTLTANGAAVHGVYFPCETSDRRRRAEFLDRLADATLAAPGVPHVVLGDFNLAPTPGDGLYGGDPSRWTSQREREALRSLLAAGGLIDATFAPEQPNGFTFERLQRGKRLQFRCDLALVDRELHQRGALSVRVDHGVRLGRGAFTDHSALILDLEPVQTYAPRFSLTLKPTVDKAGVLSAADEVDVRPENTAIRRKRPSVPTVAFRYAHLQAGARVLDFGCGYGMDVGWLREEGFHASGYDPGRRFPPEYWHRPEGQFDAVLMNFVVNVLPPAARSAALQDAWSFVKPGGLLLIASRTLSLEREALAKGWPRHEDGFGPTAPGGCFRRATTTRPWRRSAPRPTAPGSSSHGSMRRAGSLRSWRENRPGQVRHGRPGKYRGRAGCSRSVTRRGTGCLQHIA